MSTQPKEDLVVKFHQAIKDNNYELVEELLKVVDINSLDEEKCPPLYYAIKSKQWKMVQLLIENGAKLNDDQDEWSWYICNTIHNIIHSAVADLTVEESCIEFLLSQPTINIEQKETNYGRTLVSTAEGGNLRILKHLVTKYQPNIHFKCKNGRNLFHYAIDSKDNCTIELIEYIHSLGADINFSDCNHYLPLTYAINKGLSFEIIQQLIEYGAMFRVNQDDKSILPDLFITINKDENDYQLFKLIFPMIMKQFSVDVVPFKKLLFQAVRNGNITMSKYIVDNYRSELDDDIMKTTTTRQNQSHSTNDQADKENDLFIALDLNKLRESFNSIKQHQEFLISSKFHNILQLFEYLMENGIINGFFNFKTKYANYRNYTLLLFLAEQPTTTLRLLQLCVEHGADIHAVDCDDSNILHSLCFVEEGTTSEDLITKIDYFIGLGVNVNAIGNTYLATPLHYATKNCVHSSQLVLHLINNHYVDIYLRSKNANKLAFHYVHNFETVKAFVSKSNVNFKYDDGNTYLLILLRLASNFDEAKYGIDAYPSNRPIIPPIDDDYYKSVIYLIDECGAIVNALNREGTTSLHIILQDEQFRRQPIEIIKRIIELQDLCSLNYRNYNNNSPSTPLELAISRYCQSYSNTQTKSKALQTIELLLQHNDQILFNSNNNNPQEQMLLHYMLKQQRKESNYFNNEDSNADDLDSIINCCIDHVVLR